MHKKIPEVLKPNYISIRHLRALYNVECTIKAFSEVKKQLADATLTILGDGPERVHLEDLVSKHNISNVRFLGQVAHPIVMDELMNASVFISASHVDNLPVSILEAYSEGLLVIGANVGGVPLVVADQGSGVLCKAGGV